MINIVIPAESLQCQKRYEFQISYSYSITLFVVVLYQQLIANEGLAFVP